MMIKNVKAAVRALAECQNPGLGVMTEDRGLFILSSVFLR